MNQDVGKNFGGSLKISFFNFYLRVVLVLKIKILNIKKNWLFFTKYLIDYLIVNFKRINT